MSKQFYTAKAFIIFLLPFSAASAQEPVSDEEGNTEFEKRVAICKQHSEDYPEETLGLLQGRTCEEFFSSLKVDSV